MTKGFFRERKHYSLQEITDNLININMEETRRIVGILKKYGVVKAVKKNKPDFDDLSNEDIVLTDVIDSSSDIEYIFDYVGVVVIEGQVFKCYPKYIKSTEHLFENLKQVLKVIKKYNASEQLIYLFNGEDDSKIFNRLAVSIHLLETYYADGLYTNQKEIIGESKFYGNGKVGIRQLLVDLEQHFKKEYLDEQFIIIKKNLECNNIPQRQQWIEELSNCNKLSYKLDMINIPMLCTYENDIYSKFENLNGQDAINYHEVNIRELKKIFDDENKHPLKSRLNVILLLFPVKNKKELIKILHEKLWHMQNI